MSRNTTNIQSALEDLIEEVIGNHDFERDVENALEHQMGDAVKEGLRNYDFSDAINDGFDNYDFSDTIKDCLDSFDFSNLKNDIKEELLETVLESSEFRKVVRTMVLEELVMLPRKAVQNKLTTLKVKCKELLQYVPFLNKK